MKNRVAFLSSLLVAIVLAIILAGIAQVVIGWAFSILLIFLPKAVAVTIAAVWHAGGILYLGIFAGMVGEWVGHKLFLKLNGGEQPIRRNRPPEEMQQQQQDR